MLYNQPSVRRQQLRRWRRDCRTQLNFSCEFPALPHPEVPTARTVSRRGGGFLVDPSPQAAASHSGSSVALNMNLVENFISEKDMERRSADNQKYLDSLSAQVEQINALEPDIEDLGDDELAAKTTEFRERLAKGEELNGGILTEAFAVVREAAW